MTVTAWCVLVVVLAPYLLSVAARSQVSRAEYVDDPRAYSRLALLYALTGRGSEVGPTLKRMVEA